MGRFLFFIHFFCASVMASTPEFKGRWEVEGTRTQAVVEDSLQPNHNFYVDFVDGFLLARRAACLEKDEEGPILYCKGTEASGGVEFKIVLQSKTFAILEGIAGGGIFNAGHKAQMERRGDQ